MKRRGVEDCIEKGLLRKIPPSREEAEMSMKAAKGWLSEAGRNLESGTLNSSVISSYLAMFHAARALLFRDGFRERSHYCIARYLEERYVRDGKLEELWVDLLDNARDLRHEGQYSTSFSTTGSEAGKALDTAKDFVSRMERLLS